MSNRVFTVDIDSLFSNLDAYMQAQARVVLQEYFPLEGVEFPKSFKYLPKLVKEFGFKASPMRLGTVQRGFLNKLKANLADLDLEREAKKNCDLIAKDYDLILCSSHYGDFVFAVLEAFQLGELFKDIFVLEDIYSYPSSVDFLMNQVEEPQKNLVLISPEGLSGTTLKQIKLEEIDSHKLDSLFIEA